MHASKGDTKVISLDLISDHDLIRPYGHMLLGIEAWVNILGLQNL